MLRRRTKKMRKYVVGFFVYVLLSSFVGWYCVGTLLNKISVLNKSLFQQELVIKSLEKKSPLMGRYLHIVELLSKKAGEKLTPMEIIEVSQVIVETCVTQADIGLTEAIVFGLIEVESNFDPKAVSYAMAYGLTQCLEVTFMRFLPQLGYPQFSTELAFNPVINVRVGLAELVRLRKFFLAQGIDSWEICLAGYYWGERPAWAAIRGTKEEKNGLGLITEYGRRVLTKAGRWRVVGL
jgi:hypothetical protein